MLSGLTGLVEVAGLEMVTESIRASSLDFRRAGERRVPTGAATMKLRASNEVGVAYTQYISLINIGLGATKLCAEACHLLPCAKSDFHDPVA